MPVSDDAHAEVLHRLDSQDRILGRIEKHGRETNGRIGRLEMAQAIDKDRREQALGRRTRGISIRGQWIGGLAMLAGWATILVILLTHS